MRTVRSLSNLMSALASHKGLILPGFGYEPRFPDFSSVPRKRSRSTLTFVITWSEQRQAEAGAEVVLEAPATAHSTGKM